MNPKCTGDRLPPLKRDFAKPTEKIKSTSIRKVHYVGYGGIKFIDNAFLFLDKNANGFKIL